MSMTTEFLHGTCTIMPGGKRPENRVNELLHNYLKLVQEQKLGWTEHLRLSRVRYEGGEGTALDVVTAQTQLAQARSNYYAARANYLNARADLEVASGR